MKNFIQPGKTLTLTAPAGGVVSGGFYFINNVFGVACGAAVAGAQFDLDTSGGVFELPKAAGTAWGETDDIYWDATAKVMTKTATNNKKVGVASEAAAADAVVGRVRLNAAF